MLQSEHARLLPYGIEPLQRAAATKVSIKSATYILQKSFS